MQTKEQHRRNNLKLYHKKRQELIAKLGGKCIICGSTEFLEFDHIHPTNKKIAIGNSLTSSLKIKDELPKCQLLCRKCHIEKSKNDGSRRHIKINQEIANSIRREYATGLVTQTDLGKKYGLVQSTIGMIIRNERWSN